MSGTNPNHVTTGLWPGILLPGRAAEYAPQLAALPADDWDWLVAESQRHSLAPLLYTNVQHATGHLPAAGHAILQLRAIYRHATLVAMQREAELRRVLDAMASNGIRPTLFKGAALAYSVYPTPACRSMGDVDLWVTHTEMPAAVAALEQLEYRVRENPQRPHALTQYTDGEIQMMPTRSGQGLVELHWGVFPGEWLARSATIDRAAVRQRLRTAVVAAHEVSVMAPEDALIQAAVHVAIGHQMSQSALRSLVDVALLAEDGLDWDVVANRCQEWRVAAVVGMVLSIACELLGSTDLAAPAARLGPSGLRQRVLRHYVTPEAVLAQLQLSSTTSRFAYLLCLTDRPSDSLKLFARSVWPESEWLRARYGSARLSDRMGHAVNALLGRI